LLTLFLLLSQIPKVAAPDRPGQTFKIIVRKGIEVPLVSLRSYYIGGPSATYDVGELSEALQAVNVVIGHKPASHFYSTRTSFFIGDEAASTFGVREVKKESVTVAPDFIELWRGYFESARACPGGLLLNLNTTSTAFYKAGDLHAFLKGFFLATGSRLPPDFPRVKSLRGHDLIKVNRLLEKLIVVVDRGSTVPKLKIKMRGRGILNVTPREHLFDTDDGQISVEAYFSTKFHVRLRHPDWPLVEVKPGALYPLELVRLVEVRRLPPSSQSLPHPLRSTDAQPRRARRATSTPSACRRRSRTWLRRSRRSCASLSPSLSLARSFLERLR